MEAGLSRSVFCITLSSPGSGLTQTRVFSVSDHTHRPYRRLRSHALYRHRILNNRPSWSPVKEEPKRSTPWSSSCNAGSTDPPAMLAGGLGREGLRMGKKRETKGKG